MNSLKKISTGIWLTTGLIAALAGLLTTVWSCGGKSEPAADPGWRDKVVQHRQEKDRKFKTSATSPMAGVKRLTVTAGKKVYVAERNGEVTLTDSLEEGAKFFLSGEAGKWTWESLAPDITCRAGDRNVTGGSTLPGQAEIKVGRLTLAAYPGDENLTLIVFDPQRSDVTHFKGLVYFPPDPGLAVTARFKKLNDLTPVKMLTSQNQQKTFYRYGKIEFSLEGRDLQLTAFTFSQQPQSGSNILFIPFKDRSNGQETYGAGRFLEIPEPAEKDFRLDFNYCYNPLCNYSPAYNCPFPPGENFLPVAIMAGEKTYPHH